MPRQNSAVCRLLASEIPQMTARPTSIRQRIEDAIEALIGLLDVLDPDPDHEDTGDSEPSLGWTRTGAWGAINDADLEGV